MPAQRAKAIAASAKADPHLGEPESSPTIRLRCNDSIVQELSLDQSQILVGRTDDNDMTIPSPYVSAHHFVLLRDRGDTILVDLNSTNGTYVNSGRVHKCVLVHDDVITVDRHSMFATYSIRYSNPGAAANDIEPMDPVIEKALAQFANLLVGGDTDLLPKLSADVPTVVGYIDDR